MQKIFILKSRAVELLLLFVCAFFSVSASAAFDTYIEVQTANAVVNVGDEFVVTMDFNNSFSSTSTVYGPEARLTGMGDAFTIVGVGSPTAPISCGYTNVIGSAYCSVSSLAPDSGFRTRVTLRAGTPGVYELTATGTPSGTDASNNVALLTVTVNVPPEVAVSEPVDESVFPANSTLTLAATAIDGEDGDISAQVSWWSNLTGFIGNGAILSATPANGRHSITAMVTDSNGVSSSQRFQIIVDAIPEDMPIIRTIAGNGTSGYSGDGGPAVAAQFDSIRGATRTPQGDLYIADSGNEAIRRVGPDGVVSTVLSGQIYSNITAVASDAWGNVYWADNNAWAIKKLTPDGVVSTAAGGGWAYPQEGFASSNVRFDNVTDLAINELGEIFIVISSRHRVFKVGTDNIVYIAAGNGVNSLYPTWGGLAVDNPISYPTHIALDSVGNLYISQNVTNFERILKVDTAGVLTRYAGAGTTGFAGDFGPATDALLNYPRDLVVNPDDELLILDLGNQRIRKVDAGGTISTVYGNGDAAVSGDGGFAIEAGLAGIGDLDIAANGDLLLANAFQIRLISQTALDVDLAVSAQGDTVVPQGETAGITYTLTNNPGEPVENVFLTLTADSAISTTGAGGEKCAPVSGTEIKCRLDRLEAGASAAIEARVDAAMPGVHTVSAVVSSYFNELAPSDNQADLSYSVNQKPVLTITSPQPGAIYLQTDPVTLSATASDAEDGSLGAQIEWVSSIDGALGQGASLTVNLSPGMHGITASVVDSGGASSQQQLNVSVQVLNTPPEVAILSPADQSSFSVDDGPIAFGISASDAQDGNLNSQVTLQSSIDGVISSPAALSAGTHVITAAVTDAGGLSASDSITITVTPHVNVAPQIEIQSPGDQASISVDGNPVAFTIAASDAEDGNLVSQVSLTSSIDGPITSPATLSEGVHTIIASVTDSEGLSATDSITLTITPHVNAAPQVSVLSPTNQASISVDDNPVTFTVAASDAEDGNLVSQVSLTSSIDGPITSPATLSEGVHTITASVTDSEGLSVSTSIMLAITPHVNAAPQVTILSPLNGQTVLQSSTVTLAAQATDSEDGDLSSAVTWHSSIDGAIVSPAQLSPGVHTITASVSDSEGLAGSASVLITVTDTDTPSYCASRGSYATYEWVAGVGLNGESHVSSGNGGYLDATATVFDVQSGSSVPLVLAPGYGSYPYIEYWAIWIDFNKDGVFDNNERVFSGSGASTISGNITIPAGVLTGQTRMRVAMKYGSTPQPCETFSYGEVEDYTVNVQPGLPYQLSGTDDHVITRTGTIADNVEWVVEEGGVIVFSGAVASLTYQYPAHQVGREYRVWLRDPVDLETISNVVTYTFEDNQGPALPALCASSGLDANYEWINSVTLGAYTNNSGRNGGYLDMSAAAPVQVNSRSISATLQPGGSYNEYWAIWIDINRDGQLTIDEQIHTHSGAGVRSTTLNVPASVTSGQYRMRISMKYGSLPSACGSFTYGEVEDYLIEFDL